jgi:hypothetical protein
MMSLVPPAAKATTIVMVRFGKGSSAEAGPAKPAAPIEAAIKDNKRFRNIVVALSAFICSGEDGSVPLLISPPQPT